LYTLDGDFSLIHNSPVDFEQVRLCGKGNEFLVFSENKNGYNEVKIKHLKTDKFIDTLEIPEGVGSISCAENSDEMAITIDGWKTPDDIYAWNIISGELVRLFQAQLSGIAESTLIKPTSIEIPHATVCSFKNCCICPLQGQ
jgi:protease II